MKEMRFLRYKRQKSHGIMPWRLISDLQKLQVFVGIGRSCATAVEGISTDNKTVVVGIVKRSGFSRPRFAELSQTPGKREKERNGFGLVDEQNGYKWEWN